MLYTTHYMEEAQELSDHIAIMDQGRVIACGTHAELVKLVGEMDRIDLTINADSEKVIADWKATAGVRSVSAEDGHLTILAEDSNFVLPRLFEIGRPGQSAHHLGGYPGTQPGSSVPAPDR